ncbi:MAG TPA: hypothetical protein VFS36_07655 [Chitinophagaceae bacterium]|nr:hypothetical protein [Chitinophagaceae bacterium]
MNKEITEKLLLKYATASGLVAVDAGQPAPNAAVLYKRMTVFQAVNKTGDYLLPDRKGGYPAGDSYTAVQAACDELFQLQASSVTITYKNSGR